MTDPDLTAEAPLPEDRQNKVEAVANLLTGQEPEPQGTEDRQDGKQVAQDLTQEPEPQASQDADVSELTPKSIAQQLGMTPTQLFRDLRIPIEGGEPLTLEEVKAAGSQLREVNNVQETLEQQRVDFENETMLQRKQLQELVGQLPAESLTADFVQQVQASHSNYVAEETQALLQVRPDLKDPAKFNSVRQLMVDFVKPYGFKAVEVDGIIDHRLAKLIIDMAEKDQRIRQLEADGALKPRADKRKRSQSPARQSRTRRTQQQVEGAKGGTRQQKVAAVAALIGEK